MRKGFTLIELLIVVAIIAILAAIAVPNFIEAQNRSKISRAMADMRSMQTAVEAYCVDHNAYPATTHFLNDGGTLINPMLWGAMVTVGGEGPVGGVTTPVSYITDVARDPFCDLVTTTSRTAPFQRGFLYDKAGFAYVAAGIFPNDANTWQQILKNGNSDPGNPGSLVHLPADHATNGISCTGVVNLNTRDVNETPRKYVLWSAGPFKTHPAFDPPNQTSRYHINYRYDPTNGTTSFGALIKFQGGGQFGA